MNTISLVSFVIATGAVAFFTFFIVSKMKKSDSATGNILLEEGHLLGQ